MAPAGADLAGTPRPDLEVWAFGFAWTASFIHAGLTGRAAWAQQSRTVGLLAVTAVLLNWITTGDHLVITLSRGLYSVAGMDLLLLVTAIIGWLSARKMAEASVADTNPLVVPTSSLA